MNMKELVHQISSEQSIPAAKVRKIVSATLTTFTDLIDKEENFTSRHLRINAKNRPERTIKDSETGEERVIPAKKVGVLNKRLKKSQ